MIDLRDCFNLPEAIDQELIEETLDSLLSKYWDSREPVVLECIYELAIRQANNFALINDKLRSKLGDYLLNVWDRDSVESTESCLAIVVNFVLQSAYDRILSEATDLQSIDVRMEIKNTIRDVGVVLSL